MSVPRGGASPWSSPPLLKFRNRPPICLPIKYLFGILLTVCVTIICLLSLPILLCLRLLCYLGQNCRREKPCTLHHCELSWPCMGTQHSRAVLTLQSQVDANQVALQMNRLLERRPSVLPRDCCSPTEGSTIAPDTVVAWDQSQTRLRYVDELCAVLNEPGGLPPSDCSCVVVSGFSNTRENPSSNSLLLFSLRSGTHSFCLPRMLALYADGHMVFEVEPRLSKHFLSTNHPRLNIPMYVCHGVYQAIQFICRGPLCVLSHSLTRVNPVWKVLGSETVKVTSTTKNRKPVSVSVTEDDSTLMHSALEEIVVTPKSEMQPKISCMSVSPFTRSVAWIRVSHTDCLTRAERLLRAATVELLTALVAGTLRQHFRQQGIRHPPDVGATVAVSCRDFVPVEAHRSCEAVLLPITLPTSVEGAIPRAWAVQRRMADILDGVLPNALKISQFLGSLCLPPSLNERFSNALYGDNTVHISFLRAGGELSLEGVRVQSMLMFPAVRDSVLASFCFVQFGSETMLSVSLDKNVFPRPATVLANFKYEVQQLVEQLSMRLLTLSQGTFLPERMPFLRVEEDAEEYCHDSEVFAKSHPRPVGEPIVKKKKKEEKADSDYSLEELQDLLTTVQAELDGMKANPQGDRMEYIRKLTELENRMQRFHECITEKLGSGVTDLVREDAHLATTAVAELLAPYRDESGMSGRRFSREYIRTDNHAARKNSRSSF